MKKTLSIILSALLVLSMFAACTSSKQPVDETSGNADIDSEKISIVATTFPQYDWVREIIGENSDKFDLTLLLDNGVDLHNFQPTADDIIKISKADLFIYVGGESDKWVESTLAQTNSPSLVAMNLIELLGDDIVEEELKEGMEAEEEEEEEAQEADELEYDEHIWLSVKNAEKLCEKILEEICKLDSENEAAYKANAEAYINMLDELDGEYENVVENAKFNTILFADRFPFRYLAHDYSLDYYAAFSGCSAETEASFETVKFLAEKVDELGLTTVFKIDNSDGQMAKTVVESTKDKNQSIVSLNSMQAVTLNDVNSGVTYLSVMQDNLEALKTALN